MYLFSYSSLRLQVFAFLFVLPLLEAPKNLLILTMLISWIGWRRAATPILARSEKIVLGLLLASAVAPSIWTSFGRLEVLGDSLGWIKYWIAAAVALPVLSNSADRTTAIQIVSASLAVAIGHSYWEWVSTGAQYPELKSVGHVNQSAIYLGLGLLLALFRFFSSSRVLERALLVMLIVAGIGLLVPMRSVITSLALCGALVFLLFSLTSKWRWVWFAGLFVVIFGALSTPSGQAFKSEFSGRIGGSDVSSKRVELWDASMVVAREDLFLGSGLRTFAESASQERVFGLLEERGQTYNPNDYFFSNHGHSLWATVLVERGILGLVAFVLLGIASIHRLIKNRDREHWQLFGTLGVFVALVSFGNTTFHNEHGALSLMLFVALLGTKASESDA